MLHEENTFIELKNVCVGVFGLAGGGGGSQSTPNQSTICSLGTNKSTEMV